MSGKERRKQKAVARANAGLAGALEPGEQVRDVVYGQTRVRLWLGGELILGPIISFFLRRFYYVATTDRRVFALLAKRSATTWSNTPPAKSVEWAEPLMNVTVERYRQGVSWTTLFLRRRTDGRILRFRTVRTYRPEASRIAAALGQSPSRP